MRKKSLGFTLIEMIVVIIILGILAAAISTYVTLSTQIYREATDREKLVSSARFAIERLNRDVRNALPSSLRLTDSSTCLELTPIIESTTYTDIPVAPEDTSNTIKVIKFDETFNSDWSVVVYPLNDADVYDAINGKIYGVNNIIDDSLDEWEIVIDGSASVHFAEDSPTRRLYFIDARESGRVKYCLLNQSLFRNGILMAQDIINANPFEILPATLQRNAMVQITLLLEKNSEQVEFNNEIQVLNAP